MEYGLWLEGVFVLERESVERGCRMWIEKWSDWLRHRFEERHIFLYLDNMASMSGCDGGYGLLDQRAFCVDKIKIVLTCFHTKGPIS